MDNTNLFQERLSASARQFASIDKRETIRVVSHFDADGISACSILLKTLQLQNRNYLVSILNQLNKNSLQELAGESYNTYIFTDLGSSQLLLIEKYLKGRNIFILDHHYPQSSTTSFVHVNPHLFGIDGSKELSGAGVVYLFCKSLCPSIKLAHLAVIGAIGDVQEQNNFCGLNSQILNDAQRQGKISVAKGLRFFGRQTKPLAKLLEYSSDYHIPGISGSEEGTINFLMNAGIDVTKDKKWRMISDLSDEEQKRLTAAIIIKRANEPCPENIIGNIYTLTEEEEGTPMRDAKEFATLLNACGRLGRASLGIGVCLGDITLKKRALKQIKNYKRAIVHAMAWYKQNMKSENIVKENNYMIINAKNHIPHTIIGTIASIISKSGEHKDITYILALAREHDKTKASLRIVGKSGAKTADIVQRITAITGGESGGHHDAAGALIDTEKENEFIKLAKEFFKES